MSLRGPLSSFLHCLLVLCLTVTALAQSVRWNPNGGSLALKRANDIQLIYENCAPDEDPRVPAVDGLQVTAAGRTDSTQIINGKITRSVILGFAFRPTEERTLVIPEFTVKTDQGSLRVPATTFGVASPNAARADGGVALEDVAHARFELPKEVYAGEVFPLKYLQTTVRRYFSQWGSDLRWDPAPLTVEDWQPASTTEAIVRGERNLILTLETRAIAPAGELTLKQGTQLVNLITGNSGGFFFSSNVEQFAIPTQPAVLQVKPLPAGAPAGFAGAVGQFTVTSKAVPTQAKVGEPITWTLTLAGTGNWPSLQSLPAREVSTQLKPVQAEPKRTLKTGKLFEGSLDEDVVLIPQEPGTYSFGPYTYSYFDPATAQYVTVTTPTHTVTVLPAAPLASAMGGAGAGTGEQRGVGQAPGLPAPVPGEAQVAGAGARAPLTRGAWLAVAVVPGALLLVAAALLALRRALELDPEASARRARAAALSALDSLSSTPTPAARRPLVVQWQKAVGGERGLARQYPGVQAFEADAAVQGLWREAESFLFGKAENLPEDWIARARQHAQARPAHAFSPALLARWKMWLPLIALGLASLLSPQKLQAAPSEEPGLAAYRRGDYVAAEAAWRTALEKSPLSASLHLNLSLALAQQGAWAEATAHGSLAFAQDPGNTATQRQMHYLLRKPGFTPQVLPDLLSDGPGAALIRLATPWGWQCLSVGALGLIALGALVGLLYRHGLLRRGWLALAWVLASAGALALPACVYGYFGYGPVRDASAVLIWRETALYSVPTAADAEQQKSNVAPGTLALRGRQFLTWTELRFADGQTGWVQTSDLLGFWRP